MSREDLDTPKKRETNSLLIPAKNNDKVTNHVKAEIDKMRPKSKSRLCDHRKETINNKSECCKMLQKKYKTRHDWLGRLINLELCNKVSDRSRG